MEKGAERSYYDLKGFTTSKNVYGRQLGFANPEKPMEFFTTLKRNKAGLRAQSRGRHADISPVALVHMWYRAQLRGKRDIRFVRELPLK